MAIAKTNWEKNPVIVTNLCVLSPFDVWKVHDGNLWMFLRKHMTKSVIFFDVISLSRSKNAEFWQKNRKGKIEEKSNSCSFANNSDKTFKFRLTFWFGLHQIVPFHQYCSVNYENEHISISKSTIIQLKKNWEKKTSKMSKIKCFTCELHLLKLCTKQMVGIINVIFYIFPLINHNSQ